MIRRILNRLAQSVVTLLGVSLLVFFITHAIPADPVAAVAGPHADKETRERIRKELGLSDPLWEQYGRYLWHVVQGDLGKSFVTGERVTDAILTRFPSTLAVSLGGVAIWLIVGVPLGVLTAKYRDKPIDRVTLVLAMIAISLPTFWLGRLLQYQIAYKDGILPVAGFTNWWCLILPSLTLGVAGAGFYAAPCPQQHAGSVESGLHEMVSHYLSLVRAYAPEGELLYDCVDLHHLRFRRAGKLTNNAELIKRADSYFRLESLGCGLSDRVLAITELS